VCRRLLQTITALSHKFGTPQFVLGGGGNTSCKDPETLWVKPSGTTLGGLTPEAFVALDRRKLASLYTMEAPQDAALREARVKEILLQAVRPGSKGRPSVESPVHDSFPAVFVVHTHPTLVNGMTCSAGGEAVCRELFPEALWLPYVDPGYCLAIQVRRSVEDYKRRSGKYPEVVFLQNHGLVVAADEPERIEELHSLILDTLKRAYRSKGIETDLHVGAAPGEEEVAAAIERIRSALGSEEAAFVVWSGAFPPPGGPLTPDHIVYAHSEVFCGEPTAEAIADFRRRFGYSPRVVYWAGAVFGCGRSRLEAELALKLAQDAARVVKLAEAFGGVKYMSPEARDFIESWEVEAYRRSKLADRSEKPSGG